MNSWVPAFAGTSGSASFSAHSRASGNPGAGAKTWVPAFAGTSGVNFFPLIPAQAGIQGRVQRPGSPPSRGRAELSGSQSHLYSHARPRNRFDLLHDPLLTRADANMTRRLVRGGTG